MNHKVVGFLLSRFLLIIGDIDGGGVDGGGIDGGGIDGGVRC